MEAGGKIISKWPTEQPSRLRTSKKRKAEKCVGRGRNRENNSGPGAAKEFTPGSLANGISGGKRKKGVAEEVRTTK